MHCLVTVVEGKGAGCHASWVTLETLDCNSVNFRRKYMEHTGDPGCEHHQELEIGWSHEDH